MPYGDVIARNAQAPVARLARLNEELREASAQTILRVAMVREWSENLTYVSSFGSESIAMLALIADVDPSLPIQFLDTGMHFPQTLDYRDEVIERHGLINVICRDDLICLSGPELAGNRIELIREISEKHEVYLGFRGSWSYNTIQKEEVYGESHIGGLVFSLGYAYTL